jgi:hypothetical protein
MPVAAMTTGTTPPRLLWPDDTEFELLVMHPIDVGGVGARLHLIPDRAGKHQQPLRRAGIADMRHQFVDDALHHTPRPGATVNIKAWSRENGPGCLRRLPMWHLAVGSVGAQGALSFMREPL